MQRIWQEHKLQPHRLRTFKRSRDPGFADKLTDVVGLRACLGPANAYLAEHNANPKPFVWTKSAEAILAKLDRCPVPSVRVSAPVIDGRFIRVQQGGKVKLDKWPTAVEPILESKDITKSS